MGCWYKTCGLSKLPIVEGTDVLVVPIIKNKHRDRCYTSALWMPATLAFWSKYNDYGGGEDSSGHFLDHIISTIRDKLVEVSKGENEYHDIPVKKADFSVDVFFEAVHEGRLVVDDYHTPVECDFVMIRKDVLDGFATRYQFEEYVGSGMGSDGSCYFMYNWKYVTDNIGKMIARIRNGELVAPMYPGMGIRVDYKQRHLPDYVVESFLTSYDRHRTFDLGEPITVIINKVITEPDDNKATEIVLDALYLSLASVALDTTRGIWAPGCHEGSQANDELPYRAIAETVLELIAGDDSDIHDD